MLHRDGPRLAVLSPLRWWRPGTWSVDGANRLFDCYSFLAPLHLALCSIHFGTGRRMVFWGETHKDAGLLRIIKRLERILAGEPGVQLMG